MRKNGIFGIALTAAMLALGTTSAGAQVALASSDTGVRQIRVINDYHVSVRVYVQDADRRLHHLGRVPASAVKGLEVDADIAAKGSFRLQVVPETAPWQRLGEKLGIRTRDITLGDGDVVSFWVEQDLMTSRISVKKKG